MKYINLLFCCLAASIVSAQPMEPCCRVIGINPATNSVTVVNNSTGRLFMFRATPEDIQSVRINDAITTRFTYVIAINNNQKQYFIGPVNFLQKTDNTAKGLVHIDYVEPCCSLVDIGNPVIVQNTTTGKTFALPIPQELTSNLKTGDRIYTIDIDGTSYGVVQTVISTVGAPAVYVFPANNEVRTMITTNRWEMYNVNDTKEGFGRLYTDFPADVDWGFDIYTSPGQKLPRIRQIRDKQASYPMVAGNYSFKLNLADLPYVPIEAGKETRIKAGYLKIKSEGLHDVYDAKGTKRLLPVTNRKKIALPVGNYHVRINGELVPFEIKDRETTEI